VWHPSAAYVVAIGEDSLSYVDTTTGAVIASIPPPTSDLLIAFSTDGTRMATT
jgi:DNA-binding beta-propeller fold protein YncE